MVKEKILDVKFNQTPKVEIRVIDCGDTKEAIANKIKYPFELKETVEITVTTTEREFSFKINNGYCWNGSDIPRALWRLVGSRTDNQFLIASMVHDYILEFKIYMLNEVLNGQLTMSEYRRLTSLIFREIIKQHGTNTVKANVMSFCVQCFQCINFKSW